MTPTTLEQVEVKPIPGGGGPGGQGDGFGGGDSGGGGGWDGFYRDQRDQACRTGVWVALAAVVMLFAALTSALVVRRGLSADWNSIPLPGTLWLNTAVLLASSVTMAGSRKCLARGQANLFALLLFLTTGLGLAFLTGQWLAWRGLAARGIFLASNPSSSFFYLLTAAHGLHLFGGIFALLYLIFQVRRRQVSRTAVDVTSVYWHFMDGLWVYLFLLLLAGR